MIHLKPTKRRILDGRSQTLETRIRQVFFNFSSLWFSFCFKSISLYFELLTILHSFHPLYTDLSINMPWRQRRRQFKEGQLSRKVVSRGFSKKARIKEWLLYLVANSVPPHSFTRNDGQMTMGRRRVWQRKRARGKHLTFHRIHRRTTLLTISPDSTLNPSKVRTAIPLSSTPIASKQFLINPV